MQPKGIREDRKKIDEAVRNKKISMAISINFPALPRFITYLTENKTVDNLAEVNVNKERRCYSHMEVFPLLYLCKFLVGISSTRGTRKLLANEALLKLLGFSDENIKNGLTGRGKANQYGEGYDRKSRVVSEPTIVDNISAFDFKEIIECFNKYIKWLVGSGHVEFGDTYILDSTIIETSKDYPGAGKTKREDENEDGSIKESIIYGFKLFVLMDAKTKIPVAMDVVTVEKSDCLFLKAMVEKGIQNLGTGLMKLLLADRGFIDGAQMWQIKNTLGIDFIIPARKNMDIWNDVVGLRSENEKNVVTWDYGKHGKSGGYLVQGAVSYGQYAQTPAGTKKYRNGDPLNAVVVTQWANRSISEGKEKVLLTTLETKNAVSIMKSYRSRTFIENCGFRELKQAADLERLPQRKGEQATRSAFMHIVLCVFSLAAFIGFLGWDAERAAKAKEEYRQKSQNLREYRIESELDNGFIFVLYKDAYAVYKTKELLRMMGMTFDSD